MNIFVDDSGNTGINICDKAQPHVAMFAIFISKPNLLKVEEAFEKARHSVSLGQMGELKFGRFNANATKINAFLDLRSKILQASDYFCLSITNKRYFGCFMLVEYFLDHWHHPSVSSKSQRDGSKELAAQHLYNSDIETSVFQNMLRAMASQEPDSLFSVYREVLENVRAKSSKGLLAKISDLSFENFLECVTSQAEHFRSHCSPNFHTFSMLVNCINKICIESNIIPTGFVSDDQDEFGESFQALTAQYTTEAGQTIKPNDTISIHTGPFLNGEIKFLNSMASPGIQCADLMASSITWSFKNIDNAKKEYARGLFEKNKYLVRRHLETKTSFFALPDIEVMHLVGK